MDNSLLTAVWAGFGSIGCLLAARTLIHWFQLESYQFPGYFRTLRRQGIRGWIPGALMCVAFLAASFLLQLTRD